MPFYRLYKLNPQSGHIDSAEEMHAADDVAIIHHIQLRAWPVDVEIWQGSRKVARIDATPEPAFFAPKPARHTVN